MTQKTSSVAHERTAGPINVAYQLPVCSLSLQIKAHDLSTPRKLSADYIPNPPRDPVLLTAQYQPGPVVGGLCNIWQSS